MHFLETVGMGLQQIIPADTSLQERKTALESINVNDEQTIWLTQVVPTRI